MKRFISFVFAVLICVAFCVPAFAVNTTYVYDISGVSIPEEKLDELNEAARDVSENYNAEIFYVITDDISPCATTALYAKDAYEKYADDNEEGACFTYFIRENKAYLYCTDGVKAVFTEELQNQIYEAFDEAESYYSAAASFYGFVAEVLQKNGAIAESNSDTEQSTEDNTIPEERLLPYVVDNAGVLTNQQRIDLNKKLEDYSEQCECDIAIIVVQSTGGEDVEAYTVDFYDYNGYGYGNGDDGLMLLLSMENRDWCVSRHGKSESIFTEAVTNEMVSNVSQYLSENDFYTAFDKFADDYLYKFQHKSNTSLIWIPVDFVIGFIIAFVIMKMKTSGLTSVRSKRNAADYVVDGSLVIASRSDNFMYMNVVKTPKPKENPNTGGGGSITGSSGRTHSVSSGKF